MRNRARTATANGAPGARSGGFRGGSTRVARFTEQLVALVEPGYKKRILAVCEGYNLSQAEALRVIIDRGLPTLEAGLADGTIDPRQLP